MTFLYWLVALSYIVLVNVTEYPFDYLHKAMPAILLAVWLYFNTAMYSRLVVLALLFCALGDVCLALTFEHNFVAGLTAFLIAHVLFAAYFYRLRYWQNHKAPLIILVLLLISVTAAFILPVTGVMLWPVSVYMLVIMMMALGAVVAEKNSLWLVTGALTFMLSDSLIGINRFLFVIPMESIVIMLTYYAALYWMMLGLQSRMNIK